MRAAHDNSETGDDPEEESNALARDGARVLAKPSRKLMVGCLLASARHELKAPLQSIQGFAELLESEAYGGLSNDQQTFVQHIVQGSLELSAVLDACLELAELEMTRQPLSLMTLPLRSALPDALAEAAASTQTCVEGALSIPPLLHARLNAAALTRALSAVLTAIATSTTRSFRGELRLEGEHARLRIELPQAGPHPRLLNVTELAERRHHARCLIWVRLSALLLERQQCELRISERLDCVDVRLRLFAAH